MKKDEFTKREIEILNHLVLAETNPEISKSLHISVSTVKMHCKSIFKKLNAKNRSDAMLQAIIHGVVSI